MGKQRFLDCRLDDSESRFCSQGPGGVRRGKMVVAQISLPRRGIDEPAFPEAETGHHLSHPDFVDPDLFVTQR
jgi:hypothetical protein